MFTGFAVVRGAELAAIENDAFGIDHPAVGALWVETIGFPQAVADTIRKAAQPLARPPGRSISRSEPPVRSPRPSPAQSR